MMSPSESQATILVVDGSKSVSSLMKVFLEENGYRVLQASDAGSGVAICRKQGPDLVLLDVTMPDMDGFELCELLHKNDELADMPVIMLAISASPELKMRAFESGAVEYLTRPVSSAELLVRIRTHLKSSCLTRSLRQANRELLANQRQLLHGMDTAAKFQQNLLPKQIPDCNSLRFSSYFHPCQEVGGDIYNIQRLDAEHLVFYILDVSGHGVAAAMMTALVTQALSRYAGGVSEESDAAAEAKSIASPAEIVRGLDREFPISRFNLYMTIVYLLYNSKSHTFRYCCAGHPPAVHVTREGVVTLLDAGGPPAGMDGTWSEGEGSLNRGDRIYFYTDGLTEYSNEEGEFYGHGRLLDSIAAASRFPLQMAVKNIIAEVKYFGNQAEAADDMTFLAVERIEGCKHS